MSIAWMVCSLALTAQAGGDRDIPGAAADDGVMAPASQVRDVLDWAGAAFAGLAPAADPRRVALQVRRQDHNVLRFGRSCMETPLRIGSRTFRHGLGTHATSAIVAAVPPGAHAFEALVGVDNNDDTGGLRGTVQFAVAIGGREAVRTATLKGGGAPVPVRVAIPPGTKEIVLQVDATPDGAAFDQADWAEARFILDDGASAWLDDHQREPFFLSQEPPFSFTCGGESSAALLARAKRTVESTDRPDRTEFHVSWTDPKTGLKASAVAGAFRRFPAVDWVVTLENTGPRDTPIIEGIQSADVVLRTGNSKRAPVVHQLHGDVCGESTFVPFDTVVDVDRPLRMAPAGGRSSNTSAFPFFNVQYGDEGVIAAVGWTGQWAAMLERSPTGPTRLRAGLERTRLVLHPGERIRGPRILLMPWQGDRLAAHNRFRRLVLFHYAPKRDGRPVRLPIVSQCFDRYSWSRPDWATEAGQIAAVGFAHDVGCDTHWLDAAWFPGGFPNGVGNWSTRPDSFPRGLKPVSDACHRLGMRFVLWFEPERVAAGSEIARLHPAYVFGGSRGGLFRLDDPGARKWLGDLLSKRITEYGIDVYRNDFNIDPLSFWRAADAPDRQGMTEIRYVEGLYELWDRLLAEHPGLMIDNCSSGGRRIDLETCTRSVPLWRSDTSCAPGHPDWNQVQTFGLGQYVPLHTACGWTPDPYDFRSSATAGAISQWDFLNPAFPKDLARATMAEVKENQKFWYGDFYPLTACSLEPDQLVAYQFHRPDLDAGLVLAFRRTDCNLRGLILGLNGVKPETTYVVETVDGSHRRTERRATGRELASDFTLRLPGTGSSLVVRYRPATP
jgi:alpha-galactosidase